MPAEDDCPRAEWQPDKNRPVNEEQRRVGKIVHGAVKGLRLDSICGLGKGYEAVWQYPQVRAAKDDRPEPGDECGDQRPHSCQEYPVSPAWRPHESSHKQSNTGCAAESRHNDAAHSRGGKDMKSGTDASSPRRVQ